MTDYIQLYKKYRPRNWSEVIGQESAVKELRSALKHNRIPTAYAFMGLHGTGKTTIAKLLAKSLNCENIQEDNEPCNKCQTCLAIDSDSQLGVKYVSLANDGSVDVVRGIASEARLSQPVKHQVFILDEFHRMSPAAFDSLLIPLESESMKTLFIFCSTETDKVSNAMISRTHAIKFTEVPLKTLAFHLAKIRDLEQLNVSNEQIAECVKASKGSVRTAIVNLERISNGGVVDIAYSSKIIDEVLNGSPVGIISLCRTMKEEGQNFAKTLETVYKDFSGALEIKMGAKLNNQDATKIAQNLPDTIILTSITIIGESLKNINNKMLDSDTITQIPLLKIAMGIKQMNERKGAKIG